MINKVLNIAIIGLGEQATTNLIPTLKLFPYINIKAICDIDNTKLLNAVNTTGTTKSYSNYEELINKEVLDAIIVASTPQVHFNILKLSIKNNINIFVEKPPTIDLTQLTELYKLYRKSNSIVGIGLNFRFAETIEKTKQIINNPSFGNIIYINVTHLSNKPKSPIWNTNSVLRSLLLSQSIHPIDLLLFLGGKIKHSKLDKIYKNDTLLISGNILFENNIVGNLVTGNCFPHFDFSLEIISDKSKAIKLNSLWELQYFDNEIKNSNIIDPKRWNYIWKPSPLNSGFYRTGYYGELNTFFNSINVNKKFSPSLKDLIPTYNIIENLINDRSEKNKK